MASLDPVRAVSRSRFAGGCVTAPPLRAARADDLRSMARLLELGRAEVDIGSARYRIRWLPIARAPFVVNLAVRVGADEFAVWLDDGAIVPELAAETMAVLSADARRICFALTLEPVVQQLQAVFARPVRLGAVVYRRKVDLPERSLGFELIGAEDGLVRHGAVSAGDDGAWERLADALPEPVRERGAGTVCELVIGRTRVSVSQWRRLRPGWLLLVVRQAVAPRGFALHDRRGARLAAFVVEPGQVEARRTDGEPTMNLQLLESADADADDPREPSLELAFQIGSARISLDELDALRTGDVLHLDRPIEACAVRVTCGGATVATGELVDLDGALAVRLLRVHPNG
jgi:type III secretion protein Q